MERHRAVVSLQQPADLIVTYGRRITSLGHRDLLPTYRGWTGFKGQIGPAFKSAKIASASRLLCSRSPHATLASSRIPSAFQEFGIRHYLVHRHERPLFVQRTIIWTLLQVELALDCSDDIGATDFSSKIFCCCLDSDDFSIAFDM